MEDSSQQADRLEGESTTRRARAPRRARVARSATLARKKSAARAEEKGEEAKPSGSRARARAKPEPSKSPAPRAKKRGAHRSSPQGQRRSGPPAPGASAQKLKDRFHALPDGTMALKDDSSPARPAPRRRAWGQGAGPGPSVDQFDNESSFGRPNQGARKGKSASIELGDIKEETRSSVNYIKRRLRRAPEVAIVLGSGLDRVSELIDDPIRIEYDQIPKFRSTSVVGHPGALVAGTIGSRPAIVSEGRLHYYETGDMNLSTHPVKTLLALGVKRLILTTAAGSLNERMKVGSIMALSDHINLMGRTPLFGSAPSASPSIFVDMSEVYSKEALRMIKRLAPTIDVECHEGVLAVTRGPVYETPAERRMLALLGADAVSMSIAPEAIIGAYVGAEVIGLALIVNDSSTSSAERLTHENLVESSKRHSGALGALIEAIARK